MIRFYLSSDNDGHYYIVPVDRREEWIAWCELDDDDEASWEAPNFAIPLNGSPCLVTFTDPQIEGC